MKTILIFLVFCFGTTFCFGQFERGYYFTKDRAKITGLLKFQYNRSGLLSNKWDGDCRLIFKNEMGAKSIALRPNEVCCFVIERDSFAVMRNFRLNSLAFYPQDFAKIVVAGRINLYSYYSTVSQKGVRRKVTDWFIEKDGKTDKLTKKRFDELMPIYLQDYPDLVSGIKNKTLRYRDTEKILKLYNDLVSNKI